MSYRSSFSEGCCLGLHQFPRPPVRLFSLQVWGLVETGRKGILHFLHLHLLQWSQLFLASFICFRLLDIQGVRDFSLSTFKYESSV